MGCSQDTGGTDVINCAQGTRLLAAKESEGEELERRMWIGQYPQCIVDAA